MSQTFCTSRTRFRTKLSFIAYHVPRECKVVLIGHSAGAYIALQMMKRYHDKDKFLKGFFYFPPLSTSWSLRVAGCGGWCASTFNGRFFSWLFFFSLMPSMLKKVVDWMVDALEQTIFPRKYSQCHPCFPQLPRDGEHVTNWTRPRHHQGHWHEQCQW